MVVKPVNHRGYKLFHDGAVALAEVEHNGIRMDVDYLHRAIEMVHARTERQETSLARSKLGREWKKRFGSETKLGSRPQLAEMLFGVMKLKCSKLNDRGHPIMDEEALRDLNSPFVSRWLTWQKWRKAESTYLRGLLGHVASDGRLHPSFSLNTTLVYRSSSQDPNFQNQPIRDQEFAELVRRAFIASDRNHYFGESDFNGAEVRVSCCYHKDPVMINYVLDKTTDMHRDMAMQIFLLAADQMTTEVRYCAKNKFVFPQFYGDYYHQCARLLWHAIDRMKLRTADGIPMRRHLRRMGIRNFGPLDPRQHARPGSFVHHLREVENDFWQNRFRVYGDWKEDWYQDYLERGYFDSYTGFRFSSPMSRKHVSNYAIQGSAFHCLLWCLIRIVRLLKKYKMKSMVVGQIHDSIVSDIYYRERRQFFEMVHEVMSQELVKHWKWICIPMEVDMEISDRGGSWFAMRKYDWN